MQRISYVFKGQPRTVFGAEKWSDLNEKQFLPLVRALNQRVSDPAVGFMIPLLCSNIPKAEYQAFEQVQALQLTQTFEFVETFTDLPFKWLIPKLEIARFKKHESYQLLLPKTTLYGPAEKLKNLTFEEFMYAEAFLDAYNKSRKEENLNKFVAILFRKKARNATATGDAREPFNQHTVEARAQIIAHLDPGTKQAVILNYIGCKSYFTKLFKHLFEIPDETDPTPTPQANNSFNWLQVAVRLGNHSQTEIDRIKKSNLHEVLNNLDIKLMDNKAMKQEMEALRNKKH